MQGGDFLQGAASGLLSSLGASAFGAVAGKFGSSAVGKITFGAAAGGVGSKLAGGNFLKGALAGGIVAGLNHAAHGIANGIEQSIEEKRLALARSAQRERIAKSTKWATGNGRPKCNIFAQDMMRENDMAPYEDKYLSAGTWGNSNSKIPGWEIVTDGTIQSGDVAAYSSNYGNATGHMGIMYVESNGAKSTNIIIYAGSSIHDYIGGSNWNMWQKSSPHNWVFWRYIGQ
jgi:hypothetical protein